MKKFFLQRRVQKSFLFLSFVCLIPMWLMLNQHAENIPITVYILGVLAAIFFLLDRFFKPWENERAEARMERAKNNHTEQVSQVEALEAEHSGHGAK